MVKHVPKRFVLLKRVDKNFRENRNFFKKCLLVGEKGMTKNVGDVAVFRMEGYRVNSGN